MGTYRYTFVKFLRDWALIIGMIVGASCYLIYHSIPALHPAGPVLEQIVRELQPSLLFVMLFLSFCKIEPHQMRPHRWMGSAGCSSACRCCCISARSCRCATASRRRCSA